MAISEGGGENINLPGTPNSSNDDYMLIRKYCPICCKLFARAPVFRCDYGHLACSICCPKLKSKCAFCSSSIGSIRYKNIEEILGEELSQNDPQERGDHEDHDKYCPYVPRSCPFSNCKFVVPRCKLHKHISDKHTSNTMGFVFNQPFQVVLNPTIILQEENNHKVRFALRIEKYSWNNPWITLVLMPCEASELGVDQDMEEGIKDIEIEAFFPNPFPMPAEVVEANLLPLLSGKSYSTTDIAQFREIISRYSKLWFPMKVEYVTSKDLEWWREGPYSESDPFIENILSNLRHSSGEMEDIERYIPRSSEEIPTAMKVEPIPDPDPSFAHANVVLLLHIPELDIPISYWHYIGCTPLSICIKQRKKT